MRKCESVEDNSEIQNDVSITRQKTEAVLALVDDTPQEEEELEVELSKMA